MASYGQWRGEELDKEFCTPAEEEWKQSMTPGADEFHVPRLRTQKPAQLLDLEEEQEAA